MRGNEGEYEREGDCEYEDACALWRRHVTITITIYSVHSQTVLLRFVLVQIFGLCFQWPDVTADNTYHKSYTRSLTPRPWLQPSPKLSTIRWIRNVYLATFLPCLLGLQRHLRSRTFSGVQLAYQKGVCWGQYTVKASRGTGSRQKQDVLFIVSVIS